MTLIDMQLQLDRFDELFIVRCKYAGLDERQTKFELLENPERKVMIEAMVTLEKCKLRPFEISARSNRDVNPVNVKVYSGHSIGGK